LSEIYFREQEKLRPLCHCQMAWRLQIWPSLFLFASAADATADLLRFRPCNNENG